jgi:hypothetical protein
MTEPTYNVVVTAPITQSRIRSVTDEMNLYWAMAVWWGEDAPIGGKQHNDPERLYVLYAEDGERWSTPTMAKAAGVKTYLKSVTWKQLGDAIGAIARHDVTNDEYQMRAAMDLLTHPDDADWDADTGDYMVQWAAFGQLMFG